MLHRLLRTSLACVSLIAGGSAASEAGAQTQPAFNWSSYYVGGTVGTAGGVSRNAMTVASSGLYFVQPDPQQIARAGAGDLSRWRIAGGIHAGYGQQFGNVLVGLEASAGTLLLDRERQATVEYVSAPGTTFTVRQSVKADWMATLRPRLGWAQDNWLAYVTGGLAATRLRIDNLFTDTAFSAYSQSSVTKTVLGWSVGGGVDYALNRNWSLRAEYLYADFGKVTSSSGVSQTQTAVPTATLADAANLKIHTLQVGVSYRF